jgi:fatty acid desaturase
MAHLGHAVLLSFHEAVHFNLATKRLDNELRGLVLGTLALVPLSVYRHVHRWHHAALSSPQDAELWPYNQPAVPRWLRVLAAGFELTCGLLFTPLLFVRGVLVDPPAERRVRRRMVFEYLLMAAFWTALLSFVHSGGWWVPFGVAYVVPAILSANLQSWRKFIEHMGLFGDTPTTLSRTIVHESAPGRLLALTMLNVSHHGTHHRFGGVAFEKLPATTRDRLTLEEHRLFATYWQALWAMLPSLADPRVGSQWLARPETRREAWPRSVIAASRSATMRASGS